MKCKKCGKEFSDNEAFCPDCGEAVNMLDCVKEDEKDNNNLNVWETFKKSFLSTFSDFTKGRASRKEFWSSILFSFVFCMACYTVMMIVFGIVALIIGLSEGKGVIPSIVIGLVFAILNIPCYILLFFMGINNFRLAFRRMQDVGKPWWVSFIPIYNIIMTFIKGTDGENKYGEKPLN